MAFSAALAALGLALAASENPVHVDILRLSSGGYIVSGRFEVSAPIETAWAVLTDYEGLEGFVSGVRESRVEGRALGGATVSQEAEASFLGLSRNMRVRLDVRERPLESISFEDGYGRDFMRYRGAWRLWSSSAATSVAYSLEAEPRKGGPGPVARRVLRRSVWRLLGEVREEILRRAPPP
ncbi:MAG: SRPBCC family protein [Elusimicrobia bacterium]|nr:SRPBCC family protein [Elusimicrobiota bacterium]